MNIEIKSLAADLKQRLQPPYTCKAHEVGSKLWIYAGEQIIVAKIDIREAKLYLRFGDYLDTCEGSARYTQLDLADPSVFDQLDNKLLSGGIPIVRG